MRKKKLKLGDIYRIPLTDGRFAYGRLFKESTLAIYKDIFNDDLTLPLTEDYVFFVGVYKDLLQDGKWEIVGNRAFVSEEDAWCPPQCIRDQIYGKYSLYHKGKLIPATQEECEGLEIAGAWDRHHVVDRIMGDTSWNFI